MINKLYLWLAAIAAALSGFFVLQKKAERKGEEQAEKKHTEKVIQNVEKAKHVENKINAMPVDDVRQRLRDKLKKRQ